MANSSNESYVWNANDYSNIITIGASALASVLLVIFKSRCRTINLCCGLIGCNRDVMTESEEEDNNNNNNNNNNYVLLQLSNSTISNGFL